MAKARKERKTEIRGVTHCKECLWYIGNRMLRDREHICPICDNKLKEEA
jgi:hypothetical protein